MKKFLARHGGVVSAFAMFAVITITNMCCFGIVYQPVQPSSAKKLRKF